MENQKPECSAGCCCKNSSKNRNAQRADSPRQQIRNHRAKSTNHGKADSSYRKRIPEDPEKRRNKVKGPGRVKRKKISIGNLSGQDALRAPKHYSLIGFKR